MRCPLCTSVLADNAAVCADCGYRAATPRNELLLAAIGPNPQAYLDDFIAYEQTAKPLTSWHWPAFFCTFFWLLHRKLYAAAGGYFALLLIVGWIGVPLLTAILPAFSWLPALLIYTAFWVLPALYAKRIYYRHCLKLIEFTQRIITDPRQQLAHIQTNGGTGNGGYIALGIIGAGAIPSIGILAAIALPAYQDYVSKSQVTQTYLRMEQASAALNQYYQQHQTLPESLTAIGIDHQAQNQLPAFELESDGTLSSHFSKPYALKDKALYLSPRVAPQGHLLWSCNAEQLPARLRPRACQ